MTETPNIVFFGTPDFSVTILKHMKKNGYQPKIIVTALDKKVGRKQQLTPPPVAKWAQEEGIKCLQVKNPNDIINELNQVEADIFIVASYGYILSQEILDIPKKGTLNVHTSLLPRYRGACPIESAILNGDSETGSSIMLMDSKMDHGPIIAQESIPLDAHTNRETLFEILSQHGGALLSKTIGPWLDGSIRAEEQDHKNASYCYKIKKSDANITHDDDHTSYRKYLAYYGWPGVFFFDEQGKRIKITKAHQNDAGLFVIDRIIPEGKSEQNAS